MDFDPCFDPLFDACFDPVDGLTVALVKECPWMGVLCPSILRPVVLMLSG